MGAEYNTSIVLGQHLQTCSLRFTFLNFKRVLLRISYSVFQIHQQSARYGESPQYSAVRSVSIKRCLTGSGWYVEGGSTYARRRGGDTTVDEAAAVTATTHRSHDQTSSKRHGASDRVQVVVDHNEHVTRGGRHLVPLASLVTAVRHRVDDQYRPYM